MESRTITLELKHEDVARMVRGSIPYHLNIQTLTDMGLGRYREIKGWKWDSSKLESLSIDELLNVYKISNDGKNYFQINKKLSYGTN